jgi:bacillithiol system protein YtxJ
MQWTPLTTIEQLTTIKEASFNQPQVILKHSTTCSISKLALNRLEKHEAPENSTFYYLDLLQYRPVSNAVAEFFNVHHESPQILVIKNGECIYDESHSGIQMDEITEQLTTA